MSLRTWVFQTLKTDSELATLHGGRVFQGGSMTSAKTVKPFLVYHIGNDTDEHLSETTEATAHRRFFQVFIHDNPGDYSRIDDIGDRVKLLFNGVGNPDEGIMLVRFLERSQDLDDKVMQTIFNYIRFQAVFGQ